jgi:hypothetical protein
VAPTMTPARASEPTSVRVRCVMVVFMIRSFA